MNPNTGHLIALEERQAMPADYERVRDDLRMHAMRKLAGRDEAQVNILSSTPLAKWARDRRKEKRKAKIAAKSRRVNRR